MKSITGYTRGIRFAHVAAVWLLAALCLAVWAQRSFGAEPPEASPQNGTRVIIDMAGRSITVPKVISRIGTLGSVPMINTFVESLGAGDRIYNHPSAFHDIYGRWKMHLRFAPQIANGPFFQSANHELLLENILEAKPDVCITMTRNIADTLERLGIACVYISWKDEKSQLESVRLLGELLGKQEGAERYIAYFQESRERMQKLAAQIPDDRKKSVLYCSPMLYSGPGELTEELLAAAGARSVTRELAETGRRQFDAEDLLRWNPDYIFTSNLNALKELQADPRFQNLQAVRRNRLVHVPTVGHMWGGHTVESPIAGLWIMHVLYPELVSEAALRREIQQFYEVFFTCRLSDADIATILENTRIQ